MIILICKRERNHSSALAAGKGTERKERKPGTDPERKVETLGSLKTLNVASSNIVTTCRYQSAFMMP